MAQSASAQRSQPGRAELPAPAPAPQSAIKTKTCPACGCGFTARDSQADYEIFCKECGD